MRVGKHGWKDEMKLLRCLKVKSLINLLRKEAEQDVFCVVKDSQRTRQSASET